MYARPEMMRLMYGTGGYNASSYGEGLVGGYMPLSTQQRKEKEAQHKVWRENPSTAPAEYRARLETYRENKSELQAGAKEFRDGVYARQLAFANKYLQENKVEPTKKMVMEVGRQARAELKKKGKSKVGETARLRAGLTEQEKATEADLRRQESAVRKQRMALLKKKVKK